MPTAVPSKSAPVPCKAQPRQYMKSPLILMLVSVLTLSSCGFVQQWQESRKQDAAYTEYVEEKAKESKPLAELKHAAATAARAQIRISWDANDTEDTIIPLGEDELAVIRDIMPRMKDKPALCREAWEKQERKRNQPITLISYYCYPYLEFLNAQGEVIDYYPLRDDIGVCEEAAKYSRRYDPYASAFMLPAEDAAKFKALPSMQKYEKTVDDFLNSRKK